MKIDNSSIIFKNSAFIKEQYKFHMLLKMFESKDNLFYSDEESYIIGRSNKGLPIWIWTIENISEEKVNEIKETLKIFLSNGINKITCKKELYDLLSKYFENTSNSSEMGFLICEQLNEVKNSEGYLDKPNYGDKMQLAKYWIEDCKESSNEIVSMTEALEEVDYWLDNDNFFVWRNNEGKAVSTVSIDIMNNQAKLTHVFTAKDERCKGYCTTIVHEITEKILKHHLVPILYTNNKVESNHVYNKVGYKNYGTLVNFIITCDEII